MSSDTTSSKTVQFDVAIVGYGPTGATLANLLAQCGITVVIIEREAAMYRLPRAVHFDGETMRVFQTVGIADELSEKVRVNAGMRFVDQDWNLLLDWPRPQELGPLGWYASYRFHQPDLENLLRAKLSSYPCVTELTNTEVVSINDDADGVVLNCRTVKDSFATKVKAQYVVGCDGARSLVRDAIGSDIDDLGFKERWLVVDVLLNRERPDLGDHSVQYCDPIRPMTYCRSPANRRRWEITVLKDETDEEVTSHARIWEFLEPWIKPDDAELERTAVYTFHSAVAKTWRRGRLMIAGDSAHLTPPFMGQGMCAGIRDASNLAWKLALCIKRQVSGDILDSYQQERAPNVVEFIETAMRLGGLINNVDRETALTQADTSGSGSRRMATITPPLGPSTLAGLVSGDSTHRGKLYSQPLLGNEQRLDDFIGYEPVLILRHKLPGAIVTSGRSLDAETHPALVDTLNELNTNALLVRPDRYIAASAVTQEDIVRIAALKLPSPISNSS